MHHSSVAHMRELVDRHLGHLPPGKVLEVGSQTPHAPYRKIFEERGWHYTGADLEAGPNVDLVLADSYDWDLANDSFDAIISGQMLEHNEFFWLSFLEMTRILVPNGIMIHIAPSRGHEHPAPQDCWRFYRDGMVAMAKWTGLSCLEAETDWLQADIDIVMARRSPKSKAPPMTSRDPAGKWGDTVGVFRKQADARPEIALHYMEQLSRKWGCSR